MVVNGPSLPVNASAPIQARTVGFVAMPNAFGAPREVITVFPDRRKSTKVSLGSDQSEEMSTTTSKESSAAVGPFFGKSGHVCPESERNRHHVCPVVAIPHSLSITATFFPPPSAVLAKPQTKSTFLGLGTPPAPPQHSFVRRRRTINPLSPSAKINEPMPFDERVGIGGGAASGALSTISLLKNPVR